MLVTEKPLPDTCIICEEFLLEKDDPYDIAGIRLHKSCFRSWFISSVYKFKHKKKIIERQKRKVTHDEPLMTIEMQGDIVAPWIQEAYERREREKLERLKGNE